MARTSYNHYELQRSKLRNARNRQVKKPLLKFRAKNTYSNLPADSGVCLFHPLRQTQGKCLVLRNRGEKFNGLMYLPSPIPLDSPFTVIPFGLLDDSCLLGKGLAERRDSGGSPRAASSLHTPPEL